jgi:predicted MFS family arabinose efflux permease
MIGVITTEFGVIGILPQIAEYYNVSIDTAGLLLSIFAIVIALAGPFMTLFMSGFNRKAIMALSLSFFLISAIISLLSPPFWLLLVARMLPAFLQPVYISTAIAAATGQAGKKDVHKIMAIVLGGIGISTISTVPLATFIAGILGNWQSSFMVQGIVSLAALICILTVLPSMPVERRPPLGNQLKILKSPPFIASALTVFLMNGAMFTTYSYFADYLGKVNGMNAESISGMMLLFGVTGILGNWAAGKALGKNLNGTTAAFLAGLMLVAIGIYYSGPLSLATLLLIAVWGFLHTPCFLTGQAYMIAFAPDAPEFANSLSISFGNLGISMGTLLGGWVISKFGVHHTPWAMCLCCMAALSVMLLQTRIYKVKIH